MGKDSKIIEPFRVFVPSFGRPNISGLNFPMMTFREIDSKKRHAEWLQRLPQPNPTPGVQGISPASPL